VELSFRRFHSHVWKVYGGNDIKLKPDPLQTIIL